MMNDVVVAVVVMDDEPDATVVEMATVVGMVGMVMVRGGGWNGWNGDGDGCCNGRFEWLSVIVA